MSLRKGAETVIRQCLNVQEDEEVVIVTDGIDQGIIDSLVNVSREQAADTELIEYPEPENHGQEPPQRVAEAMKESDVFIAPTKKSLSHTLARINACEAGARGATMPGIDRAVWKDSLQTDYSRVKDISEKVYSLLEGTETIHITTSSGTDLKIDVDIEFYEKDTGIIHNPGDFGNLPAGEADGGSLNARGTLVIDQLVFDRNAEGSEVEIRDNKVVAIEGEENRLEEKFNEIPGARNIAEFGFGTNPGAKLIGNLLQDEKVLGTVHVAFGDNSSYLPEGDERRVECDIHWDAVCIEPTVRFDDRVVIDEGEPTFL
ncbi:MAG: aminopeptidase [Candidatus Nanohaloarchaea archaeon]